MDNRISQRKVNWHPTIDPDKCVKCGMCMNCGQGVYDWTEEGARVGRPRLDVPCAHLCQGNAITFPDVDELRELYKKKRIWAKVKKQLEEEGKLQIKE